jgi:hypothetical protein
VTGRDWDAEMARALDGEPEDPECGTPGPAAFTVKPEPEPLSLIVVGSFHWDNPAAVYGALSAWATSLEPNQRVRLFTGGCPHGAEAQAREWAQGAGWEVIVLRDEELVTIPAPALAFTKDASPTVRRLVRDLRRRTWVRELSDDTYRVTSLWADR